MNSSPGHHVPIRRNVMSGTDSSRDCVRSKQKQQARTCAGLSLIQPLAQRAQVLLAGQGWVGEPGPRIHGGQCDPQRCGHVPVLQAQGVQRLGQCRRKLAGGIVLLRLEMSACGHELNRKLYG